MIHFITPLYRYSNIKIIYSSIKNQIDNFKWHLIEGSNAIKNDSLDFLLEDNRVFFYNIETNFIWGHEQRNYFITNIQSEANDWCYFLDDDNIITPDLIDSLSIDADLILFSQLCGLTNKIRLYGKYGLGMGKNDIGSFLIKSSLLKQYLIPCVELRNSDGYFGEILNENKSNYKFICLNDKFVRYNALSLEII